MGSRTGIFGGAFNPPHIGHTEAAKNARSALSLDSVIFMPSNIPPHKRLPTNAASEKQRLDMISIATKKLPWAEVSDMEIKRGGVSYTVDTVSEIKKTRPDDELFLIVGTDMFLTFEMWKDPEKIGKMCVIAVLSRESDDRKRLEICKDRLFKTLNIKSVIIDAPVIEISSTRIRDMILSKDAEQWIDKDVLKYIRKNKLYI